VKAPKQGSHEFALMRSLAMRFRGILGSGGSSKLDMWIRVARGCGPPARRDCAAQRAPEGLAGDADPALLADAMRDLREIRAACLRALGRSP
jgi:hypothetical protein